jgi:hypothetical protein
MNTIKINDKVKCIHNDRFDGRHNMDYRRELTIGKIYKVIDLGLKEIFLIDDRGDKNCIARTRFSKVETKSRLPDYL